MWRWELLRVQALCEILCANNLLYPGWNCDFSGWTTPKKIFKDRRAFLYLLSFLRGTQLFFGKYSEVPFAPIFWSCKNSIEKQLKVLQAASGLSLVLPPPVSESPWEPELLVRQGLASLVVLGWGLRPKTAVCNASQPHVFSCVPDPALWTSPAVEPSRCPQFPLRSSPKVCPVSLSILSSFTHLITLLLFPTFDYYILILTGSCHFRMKRDKWKK